MSMPVGTRYSGVTSPNGRIVPSPVRTPTMSTRLAKENEVLSVDNHALIEEQRQLSIDAVHSRRYADGLKQRNVILSDEIHSAHRALAAVNDEKSVLLREKIELNGANKAMLQKLDSMSKGREDSVKEIGFVLSELRKVKTGLAADNQNLKKQLRSEQDTLYSLEQDIPQQPTSLQEQGVLSPRTASPEVGYQTSTPYELKSGLQQRLKFLENVNRSLQSDNLSLNKSLDHLQKSVSSLRACKLQDSEEIDALTRDFEKIQIEATSLESVLRSTQEQRDTLESNLLRSQSESDAVKLELETQTGPNGRLRIEIREREIDLQNRTNSLSTAEAEIQILNKDLIDMKLSLVSQTDKACQLKADLEAAGASSSSAAAQWQSEAEFLGKQMQTMRLTHEEEISTLKNESKNSALQTNTTLEGKVAELEAKIAAQQTIVENRDLLLSQEQEKIRSYEAKITHMTQTIESQGSTLGDKDNGIDSLSLQIKSLQTDVRSKEQSIVDLEDTISQLKKKGQQHIVDADASAKKETELEERLLALQQQETNLDVQNKRLDTRLVETNQMADSITEREENLRIKEGQFLELQQNPAASAELSLLKTQLAETEAKLCDQINHLRDENRTLQDNIERSHASQMQLEDNTKTLEDDNRTLEDNNKTLDDNNKTLEEQLSSQREQILDLELVLSRARMAEENRSNERERASTPAAAAEEMNRMENIIDDLQKKLYLTEEEVAISNRERKSALSTLADVENKLQVSEDEARDFDAAFLAMRTQQDRLEREREESQDLVSELRRELVNTKTDLSPEKRSITSDDSSTPRDSKRKERTAHKLQLWQATLLVDSWKSSIVTFVERARAINLCNRTRESEVMYNFDLHERGLAELEAKKKKISWGVLFLYLIVFTTLSVGVVMIIDPVLVKNSFEPFVSAAMKVISKPLYTTG